MRKGRHSRLGWPWGQVASRFPPVDGEGGLPEALNALGLASVVGDDRTEQCDPVNFLGALDVSRGDVGGGP